MKSGKERKTFVSIYNFPPVLVLPVTRGAAKLLGIHFSSKTIRGAAMRGIIRPPHRKPTQAVTLRISRDGNVSREFSIFFPLPLREPWTAGAKSWEGKLFDFAVPTHSLNPWAGACKSREMSMLSSNVWRGYARTIYFITCSFEP